MVIKFCLFAIETVFWSKICLNFRSFKTNLPLLLPSFSFFFSVPPDKPKIFDERGQEVRLKLGPYRIGDEVRLKCTAYGGMYNIF